MLIRMGMIRQHSNIPVNTFQFFSTQLFDTLCPKDQRNIGANISGDGSIASLKYKTIEQVVELDLHALIEPPPH